MSKISDRFWDYEAALEGDNMDILRALVDKEPVFSSVRTVFDPYWAAVWALSAVYASKRVGNPFDFDWLKTAVVLPPPLSIYPPNIRILLEMARHALLGGSEWMVWKRLTEAMSVGPEYVDGSHYAHIIYDHLETMQALGLIGNNPAFEQLRLYLIRLQLTASPYSKVFPVGDAWPETVTTLSDGPGARHTMFTIGPWKLCSLISGTTGFVHGHEDAGSLLIAFDGIDVLTDSGIPNFGSRIPRWWRWKTWKWHSTSRSWGTRMAKVDTKTKKTSDAVVINQFSKTGRPASRTTVASVKDANTVAITVTGPIDEKWSYIFPETTIKRVFHCGSQNIKVKEIEIAAGYRKMRKATRYIVTGPHALELFEP